MKIFHTIFAATCVGISTLGAEIVLPAVFSDRMVLQQGQAVPVWGKALPGKTITVSFAKQSKTTTVDDKGDWRVELDALKADKISSPGRVLKISGDGERVMRNILVGEVWVCSGQSNMGWTVSKCINVEEEAASANFPAIRMFKMALVPKSEPDWQGKGDWHICNPNSVKYFSAVAYFFGRDLHQKLEVPVGLINTSWGGTRCEAWTSKESLKAVPEAKNLLADWVEQEKQWPSVKQERLATFKSNLAKWENRVKVLKEKNANLPEGEAPTKLPRRPQKPVQPITDRHHPYTLYNGMIKPVVGYAMQGAIWYQGESNHFRARNYEKLFPNMIQDWRQQWGREFPFYWVQLANFKKLQEEAGLRSPWAELQNAQRLTLSLPKTGMAV